MPSVNRGGVMWEYGTVVLRASQEDNWKEKWTHKGMRRIKIKGLKGGKA